MKTKLKGKILAILMSLAMAFTMMPMMGTSVYADDPAPPAPGIALGPDVLSVGSNTSGAATVHMAGTKWHVIGYGVSQKGGITQVASSADTMTLIAADNLKSGVQFGADWQASDANHYGKSNLKNEIEALTDEDNGIFSKGEKEGIVSKDLAKGDYTDLMPYTNGIAGNKVEGALLWPLSTQETFYMDSELRRASYSWWLRSPGDSDGLAARVRADGSIHFNGDLVSNSDGVRPAFNFNLKSVIFTSAAAGGKSSEGVGAGALKPVGSNSTNDWKLTVQSGHEGFKNTSSSYDNTNHVLTVYYSGAVTSPDGNEYVSAVVVDKDGKITHYGNIKQCKSDGDASGQIEINLDGVLSCGNDTEVYVFNEQLNGDKKTDYASKLIEITVPATAEHNYLWESMNDENHKGVCAVCGEEITEKHTYNQGRCNVCNGACGHSSMNDSYSHDLYIHWKTCAYCGIVIEHEEHKWQDEWTADGAQHWHKCEVCQRKKDEAAHSGGTATCTEKAKCEVCNGEYGDLGEHKYSAWKNLDANQHQRVCEHDATHVEKENHKWDTGKVTKPATITATGVKTYTCTACKATKTETIAKLPKQKDPEDPKKDDPNKDDPKKEDPEKQYGADGTPVGPGASDKAAEKAITNTTSDKDIKGATFAPLKLRSTSQGKTNIKLTWTKNKNAVKYVVYGNRCNASGKKYKPVKLATVKGNTYNVKKIKTAKVKKGTYYKFVIVALNKNNNVVSTSKTIHVATKGGKVGNHKSVTVKAKVGGKTKAVSSVSIKKGKSLKLIVKLNPAAKKLKVKKHLGLRYETTNAKVATVSGGKIKAKGKGTCYIFAYAQNGVAKAIKVTVK